MELSEKELLRKFLDNAYTPEEWQEIQLLLQRPGVQATLEEISWTDWLHDAGPSGRDERRMLQEWKNRLDTAPEHRSERQFAVTRRMPVLSLLRNAAVWTGIVLVTGLAIAYLHSTTRKVQLPVAWKRIVNRQGIPVRYELPDSSEVFLGAGSELTYPTGFDGNERRFDLSGEAFFNVKHDARKPFVVYTGDLKTTDIGTSFKIEAFKGQPITVAVASGKVSVSRQEKGINRQLALLTPGRRMSWDNTAHQTSLGEQDVYTLDQWTMGTLIFEKETMADVSRILERRYGVTIELGDFKVAQYRVTGSFSAGQPVDDILKMLSMLGKFHYKPNGKSSYLITQIK